MFPPVFGIDIGNSGAKLARLHLDTKEITAVARIDWDLASGSPAHLHPSNNAWLKNISRYIQVQTVSPESELTWVLSSVRGDAGAAFMDWAREEHEWTVLQPTHETLPLQIDVEFPERVGIDRLLAAYAASLEVHHRPIVVIQAGSAVTMDLVTHSVPEVDNRLAAKDSFRGGAILPGVPMMLRLLGRAADQLPELESDDLVQLPSLPGRNTQEAMQCGVTGALVGGAAFLLDKYREQYGRQVPAVVSGGDGPQLLPLLEGPTIECEQLVLRGLLQFAISAVPRHYGTTR